MFTALKSVLIFGSSYSLFVATFLHPLQNSLSPVRLCGSSHKCFIDVDWVLGSGSSISELYHCCCETFYLRLYAWDRCIPGQFSRRLHKVFFQDFLVFSCIHLNLYLCKPSRDHKQEVNPTSRCCLDQRLLILQTCTCYMGSHSPNTDITLGGLHDRSSGARVKAAKHQVSQM